MAATAAEEYVEITKTNEIANRQMKHVEVKGKEILIANIDGKFYALNDRCGHMNALLSMGNIDKRVHRKIDIISATETCIETRGDRMEWTERERQTKLYSNAFLKPS